MREETLQAQARERQKGSLEHELTEANLDSLFSGKHKRVLYHRPGANFWGKTVPELSVALGCEPTRQRVKHKISEFKIGPLGRAKSLLLVRARSRRMSCALRRLFLPA